MALPSRVTFPPAPTNHRIDHATGLRRVVADVDVIRAIEPPTAPDLRRVSARVERLLPSR